MSLDQHGRLVTGDVVWGTFYQDTNWKPFTQQRSLKITSRSDNSCEGVFQAADGSALFDYRLQMEPQRNGVAEIQAKVSALAPFKANALMFDGRLPTDVYAGRDILVDGEAVTLPVETGDNHVVLVKQVRELVLPVEGGLTIQRKGLVMIVDNRKFGGSDYSVRLGFEPRKGEMSESQFAAIFQLQPLKQTPLAIWKLANRSFADEVAEDGQGGWTDQGPDNDLRSFNAGSEVKSAVDFDVRFDGPGALVLSREAGRSDKINAALEVSDRNLKPQFLHLLHSSAYTWGKVGLIKVTYEDGEEQVIEVNAKEDIGNWWNPAPLDNASVAWTGDNGEAKVGLYESRFALQSKPVKRMAFAAAGEPIWMIVGATLVEGDVPLLKPTEYVVQPGKDWAPIELPTTITPGSALDFSDWTEAPAGKHGRVIATPDGHFAFADTPDKPVRFWGANINFGVNFLPKPDAKALAKRLRQMGYNSVRIHHFDVLLAGGWNAQDYTIDAEMLDRLDYLFACMKKEGLYVSTDLFTIRRIREPAVAAIDGNNLAVFKALVPIMPEAMKDWKRFARDFLTHENPYTGMTWAEDPALFSICPVNEDTIWAAINSNPKVRELWNAKFEDWYQDQPDHSEKESDRAAAFNRYLAEKQIEADAEMRHFLKNELGCKALITGNNWKNYRAQTPIRAELDYVDNHGYWDHPNFPQGPWKLPYSHSQRSATQDRAEIPGRLFLSRIDGLPFMVTEFNFVYPNRYRAEGGPLVGAYASLQDWDGLYRFSWAHNKEIAVSPQPAQGFDIAADPIGQLGEHIIGMFWRRGDMPSFEEKAVYVVNKEEAFAGETRGKTPRNFPKNARLLGLSKRVASSYQPEAKGAQFNEEFHQIKPRDRYQSELGNARVILEAEGDFLAETLQSKALVFQNESLDAAFVRDVTGGSTTVFVGAVDDQPIAESQRLLILHLTNVLSSGMTFGETGMHSILNVGQLPLLVRRGSATIRISNGMGKSANLYALDLAGNRVAKIPFRRDGDAIEFQAETIADDGRTTLAYELAAD